MLFSNFRMRSNIIIGTISLIGFASFFGASPTRAAVINGDFENGSLSGWQTIGDTNVENGQALLSANGVSKTDLENFLGLNSGTLDYLNNVNVTTGSAIKQTITVATGDILSFDWLFKANDYLPFNDFSFFSISFTASKLADVFQVGDFGQTESQTSYTFQTAGTYTLGLGVVNAVDTGLSSNIKIDNVKLTTSVPEPGSLLGVLAVGAFGANSLLKRKQQQKAVAKG